MVSPLVIAAIQRRNQLTSHPLNVGAMFLMDHAHWFLIFAFLPMLQTIARSVRSADSK